MLTKENVDLLITCFINGANQKSKGLNYNDEIEISTQGLLNWDSIYLLKCIFNTENFIGKENNFVKVGLKDEDFFFREALHSIKTLYLKDKNSTIKIIEKVNLKPDKSFDVILYIKLNTYNYFKKNNIFEITLKELNKLINRNIEAQIQFLDMLEKFHCDLD